MANMKTASVNVRIQEDVKKQAEEILVQLGLPKSREELTKEEFDKMMNLAVEQVRKGQTTPVEEVFEELYRGM